MMKQLLLTILIVILFLCSGTGLDFYLNNRECGRYKQAAIVILTGPLTWIYLILFCLGGAVIFFLTSVSKLLEYIFKK